MRLFKLVNILAGILIAGSIWAASSRQLQCASPLIKYFHQQLVLNAKTIKNPQVYVIINIASQPILLNHEKNPPSASAGWASKLSPNLASALILMPNQQPFNITCSVFNTNQTLNCQKILKTCVLTNVKINRQINGNFWIVENSSLEKVLSVVKNKLQN